VQLIRPQNHLVSTASIFISSREEFTTTESATIGYHDFFKMGLAITIVIYLIVKV
jgi:hypothetical protein